MPFNAGESEDDVLGLDPVDIPMSRPALSSPAPAPSASEDADVNPPVDAEPEPLPEFDSQYRTAFEGLLYLGYLTKSFSFLGHSFTIRTVDTDTVLEIGMLHQPWLNTMSDMKAYQALLCAASVVKLDGRPLAVPLGTDDTDLQSKFLVVRKWYPATIDYVYNEYLLLEQTVDRVIEAMRNGHLVGGASSEADSTPGLSPVSA